MSPNPRRLILAGLLAAACLAGNLRAAGWWDALAPRGLDGAPVAFKGRWVVVLFTSIDCPLANSSLPTLEALSRQHPQATFLAAYEDADATLEQLRAHARDYRLSFGAIDDRSQALSAFAKAEYTPEVAVYTAGGLLVYRGRIDDKQGDVGQARPSATEHDLEAVLNALDAGRSGPFPFHPGFGCALPRKVSP